jgi:serine/threonine protein kinase
MPLATGSALGSYIVEAPLGEGGMGEVYRARDTRLHRNVAIKVLPPRLTADDGFLITRRAVGRLQSAGVLNRIAVGGGSPVAIARRHVFTSS